MKTFSFIKNQKIFFGIVAVVFIIGIVSFIINGFNVDIDFVGGTEISYDINKTVTKDDEAAIEAAVIEAIGSENFSSLRVSGETVIVRTMVIDNADNNSGADEESNVFSELRTSITDAVTRLYDNTDELAATVDAKVAEIFAGAVLSENSTETSKVYTLATADVDEEGNAILYTWTEDDRTALEASVEGTSVSINGTELTVSFTGSSPVEWLSTDSVSAEVSAGLRDSAITATVVAVLLMLVYIAIRFQISSAFAAIICLMHDLFVMIVAYSLFDIPVNANIIAALLTILGYSINATIIIFDRIRENDKKFTDGESFGAKVDDGIRCTLWRSVNTTLTTLFTIGMIYIMGVTSIKNFALPLIVGIVAGLFSSVCLAGPLWRLFKKLGKRIRNK